MELIIDIGNTQTVWGICKRKKIKTQYRTTTTPKATEDEFVFTLHHLLQEGNVEQYKKNITKVLVSSVVPPVNAALATAIERFFGFSGIFLEYHQIPISINYNPPSVVGIDRLVSAYAVTQHYNTPAIIIDLGTATTINAIDTNKTYKGGAVCPGIGTGAEALFTKASRLTSIQLTTPTTLLGRQNTESLIAGIVGGHALMITGFVEQLSKQLQSEKELQVLVTGGWHKIIAPLLPPQYIIDPDLTLKGIALLT